MWLHHHVCSKTSFLPHRTPQLSTELVNISWFNPHLAPCTGSNEGFCGLVATDYLVRPLNLF